MAEASTSGERPTEPPVRRPTALVVAFVVAVVLAVLLAGTVVAVARWRDRVTSVGCVATRVARSRLPSIVTISANADAASGTGSGEVIRADGYILTNNHVIAAAATHGSISVLFSDGATDAARLVGRDVATDLAVLKVEPSRPLDPIPWGSSSNLAVGQPVIALGAPLGLANTVTTGIVSALDRSVNVPAENGRSALLVSAVQTDAAINPGNSGGALVDCEGRLVGVPTAGATVPAPGGGASAGNIGIGFAIPSDFARSISDELIAHGVVTHAFFGVRVAPVTGPVASGATTAGLIVVEVTPAGPASSAGIRAGDIITELNGAPVTGAEQLQALTLTKRAGDVVEVTVLRAGAEHVFDVTLQSQPSA